VTLVACWISIFYNRIDRGNMKNRYTTGKVILCDSTQIGSLLEPSSPEL